MKTINLAILSLISLLFSAAVTLLTFLPQDTEELVDHFLWIREN